MAVRSEFSVFHCLSRRRERSELARKVRPKAWWRWPMPVVCCSSQNPSCGSLQKISELYDRGFAAAGKFNEFDNLPRIQPADTRGYA